MKNENLPEIEQGQHERLCAYVFGELQGAERAALEAELLRSPELRREEGRLTATIGLVKRAVPDEGLSADVRRELLASARRSRFRFLSGRRLATLVAAVVVLAGGALMFRLMPPSPSPSRSRFALDISDGARTARVDAPQASLARKTENEKKLPETLERPQGPGSSGGSQSAEVHLALKEEQQLNWPGNTKDLGFKVNSVALDGAPLLDALGYGGAALSAGQNPVVVAQLAALNGEGAVSAQLEQDLGLELANFAPTSTPSAASGEGFIGATVALEKRASERRGGETLQAAHELLAQSGAGESHPAGKLQPPRRDSDRSSVATADTLSPAEARMLEDIGYGGEEDELEAREKSQDSFRARRENALTRQQEVAQVVAQVEGLLGACRLAPGESPRAMFFRYFGDSPFLLAAEERLSTFGVDVDTASYALTRAYLNRGELPPRAAVRTEEFVNYFKADQAPPTDGRPFAIGLELAPSLFASDSRAELLRVTVRGKDTADFERQPLNLTFVIDNSGSMQEGGRLELVKHALALLLRQLYASDTVAIVKFSNSAALVTPALPAARRGELESLIQSLPIEGGTNVEAGLRLGYEQALQNLARNAVNRVILCSDGVGNIGETSAKGLLALVAEARSKGLYLNTVGVGMGDHNDAFLEELADKGDGVCNYVDSEAEAKRVFVDRLASALQPIARDVKIQVEFDPAQVESWRLLGYENRALRTQDFRNDKIDAGEVNAGHQVTALYELVRRAGIGGALATVRLRYKLPFAIDQGKEGERARAEAEQALEMERTLSATAVLPGFASATNGYQRAVLVAQLAEVLRQSIHARKDSFASLLGESRRLEKTMGDPDFTEFVGLLEQANPLLDARVREETPRVQELLDELSQRHYEQALRERQRELSAQAGEPEKSADEQRDAEPAEPVESEAKAEIERLESELRAELYRARGIELPKPEEFEKLRGLGYVR